MISALLAANGYGREELVSAWAAFIEASDENLFIEASDKNTRLVAYPRAVCSQRTHAIAVTVTADSLSHFHWGVPWNVLTLDTENKRFALNVEKDRLKNAPGFDKDKWPNMADESWAKEIHSYYGTKPYADEPRV